MKPSDWIIKLESTSSRLEKEAFLREAFESNSYQELFEGFRMAYDRHQIFNIKQVPEIEEEGNTNFTPTFDWAKFLILAENLKSRSITGNAAREAVEEAAMAADAQEWNFFYRRILIKDMRCGVSEKTFNKVLDQLNSSKKSKKEQVKKVEKFEIMLATGVKEGGHKDITGIWYVDTKMDGARLVFKLDHQNQTVTGYTRSGKVNSNFSAINQALKKLLDHLPGGIVLDGEIMASDNRFSTLSTQMNRKEQIRTDDFYFAVFDIVPLEAFEAQNCSFTQTQRHQALLELDSLIREHCGNRVKVLPKKLLNLNSPEGHEQLEEQFAMAIDEGFEGIMLKSPTGLYEHKRSKNWLKLKPYVDVTLTIKSIGEGTGKNEGKLGFVTAVGEDFDPKDGKIKSIESDIGGGWSDELREEIFQNPLKYIGRLIEVRAMEFTQDRNAEEVWALRHPRFLGFRDLEAEKGKKI